ncbi:MAG: hypothetical protein NUV77_26035, partial [Thermoguttaceae bacterium]|nr:hypothetical protein [Thermoguttaceae bacterium]
HMNQVLEGDDALGEYREVRDPVKILNVYGYGYCAIFGPVMAGIAEDMGWGPARTLSLPGWQHVACEAFYGGRWHYLDVDVRAVFRRADGTLASLDDARRDASLWKDRGPLFFPNDALDATRRIYQTTPVHHYHGFHQGGHTMDYVLRQGETFTRWWTPQGGRWHHLPEYNRQPWLRKLLEQPPRGPKPNHRHFTVHNYGNGRFEYRPNLTDRSSDAADGLYDARNVRATPGGLSLVTAGAGHAVFEVRTPYVIVPRVGDLDNADDDREASVVCLDAENASLALSLDNGITWQDLPVASWPAKVDLTRHVSGTYGYLLKIRLEGAPGKALVRSLAITTWVQVAPAALPALGRGKNRFEYRTGDHYEMSTRVVEIRSNASRPEDLLKYLVEPPKDYDPARTTERIRGEAVVQVKSPPGTRIAWFTAQGSFRTHLHEAARKTRNTIAFAADGAGVFREIYRAEVPADTEHWHYNAHREVKLDVPAERLRVRYVGDPALNNFHIYAHVIDEGRRSDSPVKITHAWRERGVPKRRTVALEKPQAYEIVVEDEPENEFVEIAVPSHLATPGSPP